MRIFFNIIWWFPYFGWVLSLMNFITGCIFCLTVVGIPIGLGQFQIAKFMLAPYTRALVSQHDINEVTGKEMDPAWKLFTLIIRILYFPVGLLQALTLCISIGLNCCTLFGIPNGVALAKTLGAVFNPVHKKCVPRSVSKELERRKAVKAVNEYLEQEETLTTAY